MIARLMRRLRLRWHRHDQIECWCEFPNGRPAHYVTGLDNGFGGYQCACGSLTPDYCRNEDQ